jgi:hypothetical protein
VSRFRHNYQPDEQPVLLVVIVAFLVVVVAFGLHVRARRRLEDLSGQELSQRDATEHAMGKSWWMRWGG